MKLRQQTAAVPKTRCAKTGGLDRSTNPDKVKFKYSTNPDKAKPAERQGQKAPGLRTSKMAELPKDVTSFRGGSAFIFDGVAKSPPYRVTAFFQDLDIHYVCLRP